MPTIEHDDAWGSIIDRPEAAILEIRWFDTTSEMTKSQFQKFLTIFADTIERLRRPLLLVDAMSFWMDPAKMDGAWRDANIIPRYNAAGVQRFAFIMPEGMPLIGRTPVREGPGKFLTGFFATRREALTWLAGPRK
jgi:hypothetical protein